MDSAEPLPNNGSARPRITPSAPALERSERFGAPYCVMFISVEGSVPAETAVRLLNRCGGTTFRAFSGDLNAHRSIGPNCFARDSRCVDFVIYLHNAVKSADPIDLPRDNRSLHWNISGLSPSMDAKERERALRKTELELETRIKLFVLVYEKEKKNAGFASVRTEPRKQSSKHLMA